MATTTQQPKSAQLQVRKILCITGPFTHIDVILCRTDAEGQEEETLPEYDEAALKELQYSKQTIKADIAEIEGKAFGICKKNRECVY